ncbi:MAG: class I SAM-dependent methyltransferase [Cyclobacteriaceae bacterium]|nr:class I SAM-dependent methyltransferase [Cyclobacteriaceae bacterium]
MDYIIGLITRWVPRTILQRFSPLVLKLLSLFYRGNKLTCPIEGKSYRKFLPYGRLKARENALCPGSMSLERHRLLWLFLKDRTDFFKQKLTVLHVAPEKCFIKPFQQQHGADYITADIESPLAMIKLDVHHIPFPDESFDVVICNHVLEHVEDDIKAMREIFRVLKHGGWAILQVPFFYPVPKTTYEDPSVTDPKEREIKYGQSDHVRMYGEDFPERIHRAGFRVRMDAYCDELAEETRRKYALPESEMIPFCMKD